MGLKCDVQHDVEFLLLGKILAFFLHEMMQGLKLVRSWFVLSWFDNLEVVLSLVLNPVVQNEVMSSAGGPLHDSL